MNKKIQILRAFAICAVVMIHSNAGGVLGVLTRPFLNFAVAMFLFISGYLTKAEIPSIGKFYGKRILRVIVPYTIWSLIFTFAYRSFDSFFINFFTANCNSIYYYIFVYIQFVLLTPLIIKLAKSRFAYLGYFITPISIIIIRYLLPLANISLGFPFPARNFFVWFIYYYLGIILGNNIRTCNITYIKSFVIYTAVLIISEIEGFVWYKLGNYDMATTQIRLTSILTSVAAILIAYNFLRDDKISLIESNIFTKIFIFLGDCSFGIYLSHMLILMILRHIPGYEYLFFPITSILAIIISAFCVFIGKKILGKRFASYLGL